MIRGSVLELIPNPNLRYVVDQDTGCHIWQGALNEHGYAIIGTNRYGTFRVHRVAWEKKYGPVPAGKQLDHTCHNEDPLCPGGRWCRHRACINADHLEPVTNAENSRRGAKAKLTWETVAEIRWLYAEYRTPHRKLAAAFGVSNCTISKVINGLLWAAEDAA